MQLLRISIILLIVAFAWCCRRSTEPEPPREITIVVVKIDGEVIHTRSGVYRCPEACVRVHLLRGRKYRVQIHQDVIADVVGWYNPTTETTGEVDHE